MERERHALAAIEGLWRALWNSPPPCEVVKALEGGEVVRVKRFRPQRLAQEVVVEIGRKERRFHLQTDGVLEEFSLVATRQGVLLEILPDSLIARRGRVFVQAESLSELKEILEGARLLRPLLSSMDLGNLEEALRALAALGEGEARREGPYVLVRKGNSRILVRGALFGDCALDCELVIGREVTLSHPGGVAIGLKADLRGGWMRIQEGYIRWGDEVCWLYCKGGVYFVNEGAFQELLRRGLLGALERAESSRMRVLIEELLEGEDPLEALKEEDFVERVKMNLLAKF
jgi:hypothetical protein